MCSSSVKIAAAVSSQEVSIARKLIMKRLAPVRRTGAIVVPRWTSHGRAKVSPVLRTGAKPSRRGRFLFALGGLVRGLGRPFLPAGALPEERQRVLVDDLADGAFGVAAPLH